MQRQLGRALLAVLIAAPLVVPELAEGIEQPDHATAGAAVAVGRRAPRPRRAIPRPAASHVVLVVEENHEFSQVVGARQAPFLNRLAARGTLLTRYYAITHPSLPNYLALVAGDPLGIHGDCRTCHRRGRTLVDQLLAAGISWKAYYQGLPAPLLHRGSGRRLRQQDQPVPAPGQRPLQAAALPPGRAARPARRRPATRPASPVRDGHP